MEARIVKLETHMDHMQASMGKVEARLTGIENRIGTVETGLATLTERVAHLPSKGFIVAVVLSALGFSSAITIFAEEIRAIFSR